MIIFLSHKIIIKIIYLFILLKIKDKLCPEPKNDKKQSKTRTAIYTDRQLNHGQTSQSILGTRDAIYRHIVKV